MIVFKFGGASIKSAEAIKNMASIIKNYSGEKLLVVVSAMGKTTNALEVILSKSRNGKSIEEELAQLKEYHLNIVSALFDGDKALSDQLNKIFDDLNNETISDAPYDEHYDQVVSKGELLSSTIVAAYLNSLKINISWVDSREYIITDDNFRAAYVDWSKSQNEIGKLNSILENSIILTQGFIGKATNNKTTTLGREGSDFSAAVFATCLNAHSVTVWKDVPGILNADPKLVADAKLFNQLPYKEAAEMTYYGASVIHPKTIKPLANKNIPLYVRSFDHPGEPGTIIHECELDTILPTTIIKTNQCLVSFKVIDFTFIDENNLSLIFGELAKLDIKINIMQNSAISFSIVFDYRPDKVEALLEHMKGHFEIRYNTGLMLITIKNYQQNQIEEYRKGKKLLLEQISRNNYRALIEN